MIKKLTARRDCRAMDTDTIIETVLEDRGVEDLQEWLHPSTENLIDFDKLKGLQEAYDIVDDAVVMGNKFLVLSDVDTDGVTSSAIIVRYLEAMGADVTCIINEGKAHGVEKFDLSQLNNIDVMIIVDSLNNESTFYRRITDTGVKLIVLDHHLVEDRLLQSDVPFVLVSSAVDYPNADLSGAGVCLKFCLYCDEINSTDYADDLWVYAAIGLVADMSNMASPENRYIVSRGLAQYQNPTVKKMIGTYMFNTESIQFSIAPLINAAMRMSENTVAMHTFLTDDEDDIDVLVKNLKKCKESQNKIVDSLMEDLLAQGETQLHKKCMFFFVDNIEGEITGLLGNRLLSIYQRPLFILHDKGEQYQGSMRAVGIENFLKIVNDTGLALCQGHPNAAGAFIEKNNFTDFKITIEEILRNIEFRCDVIADIEISPDQINEQLIKGLGALNRMSGTGWPAVTVLLRTNDYDISFMSKGKHSKFIDNHTGVIFVKWNDTGWEDAPDDSELLGVGTISSAYYGRTKYLQLIMNEYTFNTTK